MLNNYSEKRISDAEIAYNDILWFGVDKSGYIIAANSLEGEIPDFVKEDRDKAETLSQKLLGEPLLKHARNFCMRMNFIYFANTDPYDETVYSCVSVPDKPIHIQSLSDEIKSLLNGQLVEADGRNEKEFSVRQCYSHE